MGKQVVILAGGKGRRLRPYTTVFPKPLVPLGEKPILEILISQLKQHGFDEIILSVGYLAELIRAYFGNGERFGVHIHYRREEQPLGTAAPLKLIEDQLRDNFLCVNGDILTDLNFAQLMTLHEQSGCDGTVGVYKREVHIDFGIVHTNNAGNLVGWEEKPSLSYLVSMGAYALHKRCLQFIDAGKPKDMPNLLLDLRDKGRGVFTYQHEGYWLDIGRPSDYETANDPDVLAQILPKE